MADGEQVSPFGEGAPMAESEAPPATSTLLARREVLRLGAATCLALPIAFAGCGKTTKAVHDGVNYTLILGSGPTGVLLPLIAARAKATGMSPVTALNSGGAAGALKHVAGRSVTFDPTSNSYPATTSLAVVAAQQPAVLESVAAAALKRGVKIVTYPTALRSRSAAIFVDPVRAATMLATDAVTWARSKLGGHGEVLVLLPRMDEGLLTHDAFATSIPQIEQALRSTLATLPGLTVRFAVPTYAGRSLDVLPANAAPQIVLCYEDELAVLVAQEARRKLSPAERSRLYVGALGLPCVSARGVLEALRQGGSLRAIVAARPRDLANAMVDVPNALLNGGPVGDVRLPLQLLTRGSPGLAAYATDYPRTGPPTSLLGAGTYLNPAARDHARPTKPPGASTSAGAA
jgi:ribose transport system substrate-binding protein